MLRPVAIAIVLLGGCAGTVGRETEVGSGQAYKAGPLASNVFGGCVIVAGQPGVTAAIKGRCLKLAAIGYAAIALPGDSPADRVKEAIYKLISENPLTRERIAVIGIGRGGASALEAVRFEGTRAGALVLMDPVPAPDPKSIRTRVLIMQTTDDPEADWRQVGNFLAATLK